MDAKTSVYSIGTPMLSNKILLLAIVGFLVVVNYSCRTKADLPEGVKVIAIDPDRDDGPVPEVIIERIIPLEVTDSSLLGDIYNYLSLRYHNGRFYLLDTWTTSTLYLFSDEGEFLCRTKRGRGPGEIITPYAFDIDRSSGNILLVDFGQASLITLDTELNIVDSRRWPDTVMLNDFRVLDDNRLLVYHDMSKTDVSPATGLRELYQYTIYKDYFTSANRLDIVINGRNPAILPSPFSLGDEIMLVAPYDYNVYRIEDNSAKPVYRFDFGKYSFTPDELNRLSDEEKMRLSSSGERVGSIAAIQKAGDFLMIVYTLEEKPVNVIHSFKTGNSYDLTRCFELGLLPVSVTVSRYEDNSFLAIAEAAEVKKLSELSEDYGYLDVTGKENPFLIVYSIKDK